MSSRLALSWGYEGWVEGRPQVKRALPTLSGGAGSGFCWPAAGAAGLVCLGAGARLTGADLRAVRGTDIACRSGGVLAVVRGARPRAVPVLSRYHDLVLASAEFAGPGLVTGGASAVRNAQDRQR